jgi:hypothetical protein
MQRTTNEKIVPLMQAAAEQKLNREQMLRRALQAGSAVQRAGKWFVVSTSDRSEKNN